MSLQLRRLDLLHRRAPLAPHGIGESRGVVVLFAVKRIEARRLRRQQRLFWAEVAAAQPELQVVVAPTLLRVIAQQAAQHLDHRQRQARLTDQRRDGRSDEPTTELQYLM